MTKVIVELDLPLPPRALRLSDIVRIQGGKVGTRRYKVTATLTDTEMREWYGTERRKT